MDKSKMTASEFAEHFHVTYFTVLRWLKRGMIEGAKKIEGPGKMTWWEIPRTSVKVFSMPPAGRRKGKK